MLVSENEYYEDGEAPERSVDVDCNSFKRKKSI
jgi:hypothetical protein